MVRRSIISRLKFNDILALNIFQQNEKYFVNVWAFTKLIFFYVDSVVIKI